MKTPETDTPETDDLIRRLMDSSASIETACEFVLEHCEKLERERNEAKKRAEELEDALSRIYHVTSCTTMQFEIIEEVLPQKK